MLNDHYYVHIDEPIPLDEIIKDRCKWIVPSGGKAIEKIYVGYSLDFKIKSVVVLNDSKVANLISYILLKRSEQLKNLETWELQTWILLMSSSIAFYCEVSIDVVLFFLNVKDLLCQVVEANKKLESSL
jgi:hypothetical protein